MRSLLWIALLVEAFVLAWLVEDRWSARNRAEQDASFGRASADSAGDEPGLSRVVIGAPSGAAPVQPTPARPVRAPTARTPANPAPIAAPEASATKARVRLVIAGETLSEICQEVYGSARAELVAAVAKANGLKRPEALRAGQKLVLPALETMVTPAATVPPR